MDMWEPCVHATRAQVPAAHEKIVLACDAPSTGSRATGTRRHPADRHQVHLARRPFLQVARLVVRRVRLPARVSGRDAEGAGDARAGSACGSVLNPTEPDRRRRLALFLYGSEVLGSVPGSELESDSAGRVKKEGRLLLSKARLIAPRSRGVQRCARGRRRGSGGRQRDV